MRRKLWWLGGMGLLFLLGMPLACEAPPVASEGEAEVSTEASGEVLKETASDAEEPRTEAAVELSKPEPLPEPDRRPPRICKTPQALGQGPHFRDITKEVGLGAGGIEAYGNRIASVDLDGDGYPDLLIHAGGAHNRDDLAATPPKRYRWLLMNRPHPSDATKRVFVDETLESGYLDTVADPSIKGRASHFALAADVNHDGHLDLFSATYVDPGKPATDPKDRSVLLLNDGKGKFKAVSTGTALVFGATLWPTTSATFLDYDRDGSIDLMVGFWYQNYGASYEGLQDRLYKGRGDGTFEEKTAEAGLLTQPFATGYKQGTQHRPTYGLTSCDADGDGDTDIVISAYGRQGNLLLLNKGGVFQRAPEAAGVEQDSEKNFNDNQFYLCYCKLNPGRCPIGVPQPAIQCSAPAPWNPGYDDHPFRLGGNTFTTVCGDINNDGKMDLYHTEIRHWHIGKSSDPTQLLLNVSTPSDVLFKRLSPQETGMQRPQIGGWNEGDIMAAFLDFDNDGLPDIYLCSSDYPDTFGSLFRQLPGQPTEAPKFQDIAQEAGVKHPRAVGLAVLDLDGDGDLDLIVGSSTARCSAAEGCPWTKAEVRVYENLVGQSSNWLRLRLRGKGPGGANTFGIGARIRVTAGGVTQTQEISGGYGHFGLQNGLEAHFGLGASCDVETIEVRWPNKEKTVQTFQAVRANYRLEIREGEAEVRYLPALR